MQVHHVQNMHALIPGWKKGKRLLSLLYIYYLLGGAHMEKDYPICCSGHEAAEMTKIDEYYEDGILNKLYECPVCKTRVILRD